MQLEDEGFSVIEAADAEEALREFVEDARVTTVFSDINMPGQFNGLCLAHKIARLRPEVQVILTSGRDEPPRNEMPDRVQFLAKPYDCKALTGLIRAT